MVEREFADSPVLVIGSAGLDVVGRVSDSLQAGTSNPGTMRSSLGGVARNVAENLSRLGMEAILITAVGDDPEGERLLTETAAARGRHGTLPGPARSTDWMLPGRTRSSRQPAGRHR